MTQLTFNFLKVALFPILLIYVNCIGCPFWQSYASSHSQPVQKILLLKSNPQNDQEDIAAMIVSPFAVGIFNLKTNQQYDLAVIREPIVFYQVDKDDRSALKISLLHTLDSNGRVIDWNPLNGLKQNTIQIPKNITISQDSCLNSQEKLVFSWNTTHMFAIDFSQQLSQNQGIFVQEINFQRKLIKCINDKPNRRFLLIDSQGGIRSFDIQQQVLTLLIQLDQFNQLQSIFPSLNLIAISYLQNNKQNFVVSYKNSQLLFQQQISSIPVQILINNQEDQLILIGQKNLFQVWQIKQNSLIYQADFQSIKCDFRDSIFNQVDSVINFKFGSVSRNNEVIAISDKYVFAFNLDKQQPIIFKNQNFGFNFTQGYMVGSKIAISNDQSVTILDTVTQRFNYVTNYYFPTQTNYDVIEKIEVDVDLNRIIFVNHNGMIFIWSYFDSTFERFIPLLNSDSTFFIDKQLNKLVVLGVSFGIGIYSSFSVILDYINLTVTDILRIPFQNPIVQELGYVQDKINGRLVQQSSTNLRFMLIPRTNFRAINNSISSNPKIQQSQSIIQYVIDESKSLLITINSQYYLYVLNIKDGTLLYSQVLEFNNILMFNIYPDQQIVTISSINGKTIIFNYIKYTLQGILNYQKNQAQYFDSQNKNLIMMSDVNVLTKPLQSLGLINQFFMGIITNYYLEKQSSLLFILSNQVQIYNFKTQEYLPPFPSIDIQKAQYIYAISSQDLIFIQFSSQGNSTISMYKLSTYSYLRDIDFSYTICQNLQFLSYDENLNRLFAGCIPWNVIVWDINQNFKITNIIALNNPLQIQFNIKTKAILVSQYTWFISRLDYNTLAKQATINGIFSDFDYERGLQFTWDQNGDIRLYDPNSKGFAFQHAHQGWINSAIIDSTNMIITTIGSSQTLKGQLKIQFLDKDNSKIYAGDANGIIYQLSYPDLTLNNMIQVYQTELDMLFIDFNLNILIYGSSVGKVFGYYNLIEFIAPYAYQNSQTKLGVLSVLKTEKGLLFHQSQTGVQLWNESSSQLQFGFYVYSDSNQFYSYTKFLILQGQKKRACLIIPQQIIFFDLDTLDVLNINLQYCAKSIQLPSFLICSLKNQLTIIKLDDYTTLQTIVQQDIQFTINIQNIDNKNSFFVTTTQGEVICYNFDQATNQFQQQFYSKLLDKGISNYLFIIKDNYYYILITSFTGQFGFLQISQQLIIQTQKLINFQGTSSHAHKIVHYNDMVYIKRVGDLYLSIYGLQQFNLINKISSPCMGYAYKFDMSTDLDIILQHCVGIYQVNALSSNQYLASGRFTNQVKLSDVYTPIQNQIILINKNYFIDVYNLQILIYQIDYAKAKVIMLGNFYYPEKSIGQIADYLIFQDQKNTYVQLILYSFTNVGKIQLPISGESICQEKIAYEQFTETLFQIQMIFQRIQSYYIIQKLIFQLTIVQEMVLQPLPQSTFSLNTEIDIIFQIPGRQSFEVQKAYISENLFQSFNGYFQISLINLFLEPVIRSNNILIYSIQNITQFQLVNIQLSSQVFSTFQIQQVQSVLFDRLHLQGINIISNKPFILFSFTQVKNINFQQTLITQSFFTKVILFYFEGDIDDTNPSKILITNFVVDNSSFIYDQDDQNSAPIVIKKFNEVNLSQFTANQNKGSAIPLLKGFIIAKYTLQDIFFMKNENTMLFQYQNSIQTFQNDLEIVQKKITDEVDIKNLQISNNRINQPSLFPLFSITASQLQINEIFAELNFATSSNPNSLFNFQPNNVIMTNVTLKENQGNQNLFTIQNTSQGSIKNLTLLSNVVNSVLSISQSQITISNGQLQQNQSKQTKLQTSVFNILQNSNIFMSNFKFEQNKSNNGGSILVSQSQLFISECSFSGDNSYASGGSIFSQNSQLTIYQSTFEQCSSQVGGCLYVQEGQLNITQCNSQNTIANQSGGFLYIGSVDQFILENINVFNSVSQGDGGSLYISQSIGANSIIKNNTFFNSKAKGSGGAIFLDNSNFQIVQSKFVSNSAGIGGAIRYTNLKPSFMMKSNKEDKDSCNTYQNNSCQENSAIIFGNSIASYPTTALILPSERFNVHSDFPYFRFSNFQSGLTNFDLTIVFFDEFSAPINQIDMQNQSITSQLSSDLLKEISQYSCRAYLEQQNAILQNQTIKLDGATLAEYQYNSNKQVGCFLHNFKITGVPSSKSSMRLQLNGMKAVNKKNQFEDVDNIQVDIQFRSCKTGENYNEICQNCLMKECVECQNGTYSLIYPTENKKNECKSCDMSQAYSCFGDQILLRENYWRKSNDSDIIYKCDIIDNSCNGNAQKGYCAEGYVGPLCSFCDISGKVWGESYQFDNTVINNGIQCTKCSLSSSFLFKEVVIFLVIILYLIFLVIQSQDSNCKVCAMRILQSLDLLYLGVSSFLSDNEVISKIIINQFQILSTLKYSLGLNISQAFSSFLTIPQAASQPINQFTYSFDCFFTKLNLKIPIQYFRFMFLSIIFPITLIIFFFIFVYIILSTIQGFSPQQYFFYKTKYIRLNVLISMFTVFSYIASQNIYQTALQSIFCEEFGGTYYMKSQMDQICYTEEHYFYILILIGPVLFIVTIIYPSTMFLILYRNRFKLFDQKLKQINIIRRYGYLFKGYKKNTWWWEILKTWYKFIVILLATYYSSSILIQIQFIIFLQLIYLYLLMKYQPYQHSKMNKLEKKSVIYTLLIFQISIIYYYNQDTIVAKFAQIGFVFIFTILFGNIFIIKSLLLIYLFIFFEIGRLFFSILEVQLRLNFYLFEKTKRVRQFLRRLLLPKSENGFKFFLKNYLFQNNWGLYNIIYKKDYNPYRVFSKYLFHFTYKLIFNLIIFKQINIQLINQFLYFQIYFQFISWKKVRTAFQLRKIEQIPKQKLSNESSNSQKMIISISNYVDPFQGLKYGQCKPQFIQEQLQSIQQQQINQKSSQQAFQHSNIFLPKQKNNVPSYVSNFPSADIANLIPQIELSKQIPKVELPNQIPKIELSNQIPQVIQNNNKEITGKKKKHFYKLK
ncbi:transmembrane protein, putative (macronuclear) [Tetrahymena thermophila SB210]|uniref:Transmembrane protein, putative n=1 Tax=Tetrahymena thermophila (strain SB210) TaxID=312017 RepID=W7X8R3_TETTS|nr:transmembrane protein, putative [Tetrahymena thermophila SB210]EWS73747.1 transmembrane protein, putative [Tetrahymena thermophila SB210]|eukprot:XP_012653711.1 transmembrane protein, putative [Tetrahymena thermophila SB210]